jgi:hypothetical protein
MSGERGLNLTTELAGLRPNPSRAATVRERFGVEPLAYARGSLRRWFGTATVGSFEKDGWQAKAPAPQA